MPTASRARFAVFAAALLAVGSARAQEPNPWEIPNPGSYQGSMELQRREAEQQQQAQQQWSQPGQGQQGGTSTPQSPGGAPVPSGPSVRQTWEARPPLSPFANRLLGRWDSVGNLGGGPTLAIDPALGGDLVNAFLGGLAAGVCDNMLSRGLIEFRPASVVAIGADGSERLLYHLDYRGEGSRVVVLPESSASFDHMVLDLDASGRATAEEGCVLARPGSAAETALRAAGSNTASRPPSTPPAVATGGAGTLALTVSAASGPEAGCDVRVLKDFADVVLIHAGVGTRNGVGGPMHRFLSACQQHTAECQAGWRALDASTQSLVKTDAAGRAQTAALPAGRYYVFAIDGGESKVWQEMIDLHAGDNSLALDAQNAYAPE